MSITLVWYAKQVMAQVEAKVQQNMDRAAIYLQGDIVKSFGSPPPEPDNRGGFKKNSSKKWKRRFHSAPGEPPYVQTGMLRRSITWAAPGPMTRLVGSSLQPQGGEGSHSYAYYLEYGTSKMKSRPYLRPALARCRAILFRIIAHG